MDKLADRKKGHSSSNKIDHLIKLNVFLPKKDIKISFVNLSKVITVNTQFNAVLKTKPILNQNLGKHLIEFIIKLNLNKILFQN